MTSESSIKAKIAKALLNQREEPQRRRLMSKCGVVLLLLFGAHSYCTNLSSPLKLIPQTMLAIAMGYTLLLITSLRQFKYLAEFIDWTKVAESAEVTTTEGGDD